MKLRSKTLGSAAAVGAAAALLLTTAVPASAVTVPDWVTGTIPVQGPTCTLGSVFDDVTHTYNMPFTDTGIPSLGATIFGTSSVKVIGPRATATPVKVRVRATERCTGVKYVQVLLTRGTTTGYDNAIMSPETTDVFNGVWSTTLDKTADDAGFFRPTLALVQRRYDTVRLGADFELISKVDTASSFSYLTGPWSSNKLYILRQVTLTTTQNRTSVALGGSATFRATMKYATNARYAANSGETVKVQTKCGTGAWTTKATLTANSSGVVSYSFAPTRTTQVRFVHSATYTGRYTAAAISAARTIKVT